jgi:hypothetical protein
MIKSPIKYYDAAVGISIREIQDLNFSHNICNLDFGALQYLSKISLVSAEAKHVGFSRVHHRH